MTYNLETEVVLAMRDQVAGIDPAEAQSILARAMLDHRRNRRRGQLLAITAATGTAAALLVGVTLALTGVGPTASVRPVGRPTASTPHVVSAAQTSYRVTVLNTSRWQGRPRTETLADYTGSYDPVQQVGQGLRSIKGVGKPQDQRIRLLDGTIYLQSDADTWRSVRGTTILDALVLDGGRQWGPWDGRSADSRRLLATLQARGTVRLTTGTGTGAAALDHYDFAYTIAGDDSVSAHRMTGTIVIHHQSGLIAELNQQTTVVGANPEIADRNQLTFSTKLTFSDYGLPVRVTKP